MKTRATIETAKSFRETRVCWKHNLSSQSTPQRSAYLDYRVHREKALIQNLSSDMQFGWLQHGKKTFFFTYTCAFVCHTRMHTRVFDLYPSIYVTLHCMLKTWICIWGVHAGDSTGWRVTRHSVQTGMNIKPKQKIAPLRWEYMLKRWCKFQAISSLGNRTCLRVPWCFCV